MHRVVPWLLLLALLLFCAFSLLFGMLMPLR
jgi:hypothetical protein